MRPAVVNGLVATAMFASYALAQNCPKAPRDLPSREFFAWCQSVGGEPVAYPGGQPGDLWCKCKEQKAAPAGTISPQVALWVGAPVVGAAVFGGIQAAAEASRSNDELINGAAEGQESKIGQAAAVGAAVGLGVAAVGWSITKIAKWQPAPVGAPWWRRTRIVTGVDRRGATRVGLGW